MGKIYQRGKIWYVDYYVNGRRVRSRVGTSKKLAELALKDAEVNIAKEQLGFSRAKVPLEEFLHRFLEYSKATHRKNTTDRYRAVVDHFRAFLPSMPQVKHVSDVTTEVIDRYKVSRRLENGNRGQDADARPARQAKARPVTFELDTLRLILNVAIKWGYIDKNPTKEVTKLKEDESKTPRYLSIEECKRFLDACPPKLYPIYYTFLHTGMRKGELENLTWADVDLKRRQIRIEAKAHWKPKTGERHIPISDSLLTLLKKLRKEWEAGEKRGGGKGTHPESDLVFPLKPTAHSHNYLRTELIKIAKKAELGDFTKLHTLRHTFASHLVMQGVDLTTVQKLLGHTDIEMTMIYAHLAPDHLSAAVNKLPF